MAQCFSKKMSVISEETLFQSNFIDSNNLFCTIFSYACLSAGTANLFSKNRSGCTVIVVVPLLTSSHSRSSIAYNCLVRIEEISPSVSYEPFTQTVFYVMMQLSSSHHHLKIYHAFLSFLDKQGLNYPKELGTVKMIPSSLNKSQFIA